MGLFSFSFPGTNLVEADNQAEWTDVQKKIIPWNSRVPDLDLELLFQDRAARLGKSISRLIVVASLIDKPTNLGGKVGVFRELCLKAFGLQHFLINPLPRELQRNVCDMMSLALCWEQS